MMLLSKHKMVVEEKGWVSCYYAQLETILKHLRKFCTMVVSVFL